MITLPNAPDFFAETLISFDPVTMAECLNPKWKNWFETVVLLTSPASQTSNDKLAVIADRLISEVAMLTQTATPQGDGYGFMIEQRREVLNQLTTVLMSVRDF